MRSPTGAPAGGRMPRTVRRLAACVAAGATWACGELPLGGGGQAYIVPPTGAAVRPSVLVDLHVHGWSNHAGTARPGSIAWQTSQRAGAGVDVVWWTDHSDVYFRRVADLVVTPSASTPVGDRVLAIGTWANGLGTVFLRWSGEGAPAVVWSAAGLEVDWQGRRPGRVDTLEVFFGRVVDGLPARASFGVMSRPLVGDPTVSFVVRSRSASGRYPAIEVLVPLAWHPDGREGHRHVLLYRYATGSGFGTRIAGDTVTVTGALPGGDSTIIALRPLAQALELPNGLDNTIDEYRVRFVIADEDAGRFAFTLPVVSNAAASAAVQMPAAVEAARAAAARFGVRMVWGIEGAPATPVIRASPWESVAGAGRHVVIYSPGDLAPALVDSMPNGAPTLAAAVRASGGLTSIAHPFGTAGQTTPLPAADRERLVRELGAFLVANSAFGIDMIEVGYPARGGMGPDDHLRLLDILLASGIRVCGVAGTDSHGDRLVADPEPGGSEQQNLLTWIGNVTRSAGPAELIARLRACDVSYGNPFYVRGGAWIALARDLEDRQVLALDLAGVSPSASFRLYEAEVDSGAAAHPVVYRRRGDVAARHETPRVGGCRPGFARLEAWAAGRAIAFSNVVMVPPDSAACAESSN